MAHPGRGRWRRELSREERREEQRRAILRATAFAVASHGRTATLDDIVEGAGTGRNTFYDHFETVDQAIEAARDAAFRDVVAACRASLEEARTPRERVRALASGFVAAMADRGPSALALLAYEDSGGARTALRDELQRMLTQTLTDARAAGAIGSAVEPLRVEIVVGLFETAARLSLDGREAPERLSEAVFDAIIRIFR